MNIVQRYGVLLAASLALVLPIAQADAEGLPQGGDAPLVGDTPLPAVNPSRKSYAKQAAKVEGKRPQRHGMRHAKKRRPHAKSHATAKHHVAVKPAAKAAHKRVKAKKHSRNRA
ncbi:hypothetical protein KSF73_14285 [Burkholderiaceae bacterium DAT-1]|nr:hypothetical protein [Burkholderiaceae bacterium DAT-1]